jgi:NADH-quinone oxidoreductase subunit G
MAHGPGESRFVEVKRHFEKPIRISSLVALDRERCILCARCTRFSEEVSGDPLIEFMDRGNYTQINTFPDHPFNSYFSGNTVQICPVGALTASPYRFRARPWDLTAVESTCSHCTAGDRITIQASQGEVLRVLGVDADATNRGWLSDKCRFGFEFIGSDQRLRAPLIRDAGGELREATWSDALAHAAARLDEIKAVRGGGGLAVLGGGRGTNEDAYALSKFARVALGTHNVDCRTGDDLDPGFLAATVDRAEINDLDRAATILVWGPDLKEEHPTLYLRVRHAAQVGVKLVVVHPRRTGLDDVAIHKLTYRPGAGGELLAAIQDGDHPGVSEALAAGSVVALIGKPGETEDPRLPEAVATFLRGSHQAKLLPLARRSNIYGALDMGLAPSLLPGRVSVGGRGADEVEAAWGAMPSARGHDFDEIIHGLSEGDIAGLVIVGCDPVADGPDGSTAARALESAFVVAIDLFLTDSSRLADVILPATGFAEKEGTVTNLEGRVQKVNAVVAGPGQARPDWAILDELASTMEVDLGLGSAEGISKEISVVAPAYEGVTWELLDWERRDGVVVPLIGQAPLEYVPAASASKSVAGEMVLHSARTMYDDGVEMRMSRSLHQLAPGGKAHLHPDDARRLGVGPESLVEVAGSAATAVLPVVVDESLMRGVVYVPSHQPGVPSLGRDPVVTVTRTS